VLFEFMLRGLLVTGWLHADPNMAMRCCFWHAPLR
jgi:hypothetical protein